MKTFANDEAKVLLSVAISLDGFLADADGKVEGWLYPFVTKELGLAEFFASVPVFIMGRTTYEQARKFPTWPYGGKRVVVLTRRSLDHAPDGVEARDADPVAIVEELKESTRGVIWHVGGGISARPFLDRGLVDELQLDVIPVTLGRGVPLFQSGAQPLKLELVEHRGYSTGIVRLRYQLN